MKAFFSSAFQWIITGIALAIQAVNCAVKKKSGKSDAHIAAGAGFGLLIGVTLNSCVLRKTIFWGLPTV